MALNLEVIRGKEEEAVYDNIATNYVVSDQVCGDQVLTYVEGDQLGSGLGDTIQ